MPANYRKAIFPGSFDPITLGHVDIVKRMLPLFDEIVVAIGENSQKKYLLKLEKRKQLIKQCFAAYPSVSVASYHNLTTEFAKKIQANYILRGVRTTADFDYERSIALLNRHLYENAETILVVSTPEVAHISSTIVREIIKHGGSTKGLVPDVVIKDLQHS